MDENSDLTISLIDSVHIRVDCDMAKAQELAEFFSFYAPGHKFHPAFRSGMWDGKIRLFDRKTRQIYAGLRDYVRAFANDRNYKISDQTPLEKQGISEGEVAEFAATLNLHAAGKSIVPHGHQLKGVSYALSKKRTILICPTGSGKSLMLYLCARWLQKNDLPYGKKILLIVPNISLVAQMYSDFFDYSAKDPTWKARNNCHKVHGGEDKNTEKPIVISTWQSIFKMPAKWFEQFHVVFTDEAHLAKAKSIVGILTKLKSCPWRIGVTGTLDGWQTNKLVLEGLHGRVKTIATSKTLMDSNLLAKLAITCLILNYPNEVKQGMARKDYQEEIDWLVENKARNQFIVGLTKSLQKGNTLVLFQYVQKHGKVVYEAIKEACKDRNVYYIDGGVDMEDREHIRKIVETEENAIIVASYGTCQTGISIRRLHNIVFASPSKSRVRVLQSIGRQLRTSEFKEVAKLYDIADDLCWKAWENHTFRHFNERMRIYESEQFDYKVHRIKMAA